ncbi:uncharacterized protein L201_005743 [Kwoniella dendrophila CBS 6074]|uniref:Uncharacterized protein n=1 Tax=Kwoniella dendrophila CBS 6074 TaxID=1295534 RepID=A0AAX4JZ97_9TREE
MAPKNKVKSKMIDVKASMSALQGGTNLNKPPTSSSSSSNPLSVPEELSISRHALKEAEKNLIIVKDQLKIKEEDYKALDEEMNRLKKRIANSKNLDLINVTKERDEYKTKYEIAKMELNKSLISNVKLQESKDQLESENEIYLVENVKNNEKIHTIESDLNEKVNLIEEQKNEIQSVKTELSIDKMKFSKLEINYAEEKENSKIKEEQIRKLEKELASMATDIKYAAVDEKPKIKIKEEGNSKRGKVVDDQNPDIKKKVKL